MKSPTWKQSYMKSVRRKALGWISYFTPSSSSVPPNVLSIQKSKDPNKICNPKPSKYRNLVKICNELVKKVKKYGFSDRAQGGQI